jgi:hypothetical protein
MYSFTGKRMMAEGTLVKKSDAYVAEYKSRGHTVTIQEVGVIIVAEEYNCYCITWSGGSFELVKGDCVIEASAKEKFNYKLGNAIAF